jgi:hypothetical protein
MRQRLNDALALDLTASAAVLWRSTLTVAISIRPWP